MTSFVLSDSAGNYQFSSLPAGGNYTVTPSKTPLTFGASNINTLDVVAIQRHFLRIGTPLSGCPLTAADVNSDNAVNTLDVVGVQRFFLGLTIGIANVGQYQFNPTSRSYSTVVNNQINQNYDALILGDVAAGFVHRPESPAEMATSEAADNETAEETSAPIVTVSLADITTEAGHANSIIPTKVSPIDPESRIVGFQGDLLFDERILTFENEPVQKADLTDAWNVSANVLPGPGPTRVLRISAFSNDLTPLSGSGTLFNLRITRMNQTRQAAQLSWAAAPNDFFFIDLDLKTHRPADAVLGNLGDLQTRH
jgi:hypothetical protein